MLRTFTRWIAIGAACAALSVPVARASAEGDASAPEIRARSFSGAFLAARTAETDNDLEAAVRFYRKSLAFDPSSQEIQRSLMLALISNGQFEEAVPLAEKLKNVPEVERFSHLALAVDRIRKARYGEAEQWLQLAFESELDRLVMGILTAWTKLGHGEPREALNHMTSLEGPQWFDLFVNFHRALIAEQAGRTEDARAAYEAVIADRMAGGAAPETYWRALNAQSRFLARIGEREKALEVLSGPENIPPRPEFIALREALSQEGEIDPLVSDPIEGAAEILLDIAAALNRGGGEAFVRLYLQLADVLRPDHDAVLVQLGHVAEQQGRSQEAIGFYRRVPADSPLKRMAEMQLGLNLADTGQNEEAILHLKALVEDDPDDMRAYLALGGVYHSQKDFEKGAELYDRAVARIDEPGNMHWSIFYQRGIAYERLKQWEKAEPNFLRALELEPDQPQVLNYLGYSWVDMGIHLDRGLEMISRAVELRPNDGYIVDSLGWAYYRLGRFEEAVQALERAVSLRPEDPILNDHLGDAYWRVGRRLHAQYQWNHARDLEPEPELLEQIRQKLQEGLPKEEPKEKQASAADLIPAQLAPAPAGEVPVRNAVEIREHTVQPGQSLWSIAVEVLGDGDRMEEIIRLNPALSGNPNRIFPGQTLRLPDLAH